MQQMVVFPIDKVDIDECGLYLQAGELLKIKPRITYLDSQSSSTLCYWTLNHELSLENG